MKTKKYYFDVEMIIDHNINVMGTEHKVATHHMMRGLSLTELCDLIKHNDVPEDEKVKITFNIRGVNY